MGASGLSRIKPNTLSSRSSNSSFDFPEIRPKNYGYKSLSKESARQIAEALRTMLR